ncbi:MAG TPA: aminotransferase class I/II-fold pyridoxal phosphate-dependent enzyme [Ignavibacteria bacterium]
MKHSNFKVSKLAEAITPPEIIRLANEINDKINNGEQIYNLTIGDFNPQVFPIPELLKEEIIKAYNSRQTNYPPANGLPALRKSISGFIKDKGGFNIDPEEIIIASGARPIIYSVYRAIVDPGDSVIYPVPSWNNEHYCLMNSAKPLIVETKPENNFLPSAEDLKPFIKEAKLLALCSPQNPTGTLFKKQQLKDICDLIMEENYRRKDDERPLYLLLDQIYWILTHQDNVHYNPVDLTPEIKDYVLYVDGISKCFASTGLRVGWSFGPPKVIKKMQAIILHMGAWAPRAEQTGLSVFLSNKKAVDEYLANFKSQLYERLIIIYDTFTKLKEEGFDVEAVNPQGAIYLTVKIDIRGKKTSDGKVINKTADIYDYILNDARIATVPFYAFGSSKESPWYRISVGTCTIESAKNAMESLKKSLRKLR